MSKRHIPESHTAHPNVTPLIDIIMCLIIFFMLVAKIGVTTGAQKIDIPASVRGTKITDMANTLILNIPDEVGDSPVVMAFIKPPNGGNPTLTTLYTHDPTSGQNTVVNTLKLYKGQSANFKVIIRARADLPWQAVAPVIDCCNLADVQTIAFNTKPAGSKM